MKGSFRSILRWVRYISRLLEVRTYVFINKVIIDTKTYKTNEQHGSH